MISATAPSDFLKEKHSAFSHCMTRDAIAAKIVNFRYIKGKDNWADIRTKPLSPCKFCVILRQLLMKWKDWMGAKNEGSKEKGKKEYEFFKGEL